MEKLEISIRERPVHLSKLGTNEISGTLPLDGTGTESRESKPQEFPHDIPVIQSLHNRTFNPWGSHTISLSPQLAQRALDYRFSVMTPRMLPTSNVKNPYLHSWFGMSLYDDALFTALASASLSHQKVKGLLSAESTTESNGEDEATLATCYKATIKAVNDAMQDPKRATTDATILAILMTIEMPAARGLRDWSQQSPFQAPLRNLQWLNVHGARQPHMPHQDGLCRILQLRGGLHNIKTPGVAAAIFYRVLVNSTLTLSPPPIPFFPLCETESPPMITHARAEKIDSLGHFGLSDNLTAVLQEMAAYTYSIQDYLDGDMLAFNSQAMCDQRNLAQYHLMSLVPRWNAHDWDNMHEACRLAATIYSMGVTFPISAVGAPFEMLIKLLKFELQSMNPSVLLHKYPKSDILIFWILTIGGIAATENSERDWFVKTLSETPYLSRSVKWEDMKRTLAKVLWLDSACDMAGKQLWSEACARRHIESQPEVAQSHPRTVVPCAQCHLKKIKCDKGRPCANCVKYGVRCCPKSADPDSIVQTLSGRQRPCETCRRRRVKCDKGTPCKRCLDGGVSCVYQDVHRG